MLSLCFHPIFVSLKNFSIPDAMILATAIATFIVAFLPTAFLLKKRPGQKAQVQSGLHVDVQGIIHRVFTDKKQQQPVDALNITHTAGMQNLPMIIVEERAEFGGYNHLLFAKPDEIRQAGILMQILQLPSGVN